MLARAVVFVAPLAAGAQSAPSTTLRIGVVTPRAAASAPEQSALRGIRFGASEAEQTARLFGSRVEVFEASGDGRKSGALAAAAFLVSRRGVQILIGTSVADSDSLSKFAESRQLVFLNVASRSGALRAACRRYSFHVEAGDGMYAKALRLAALNRGGAAVGTEASPASGVALWDARLERFGAGQLNDRFRTLTRQEMDGSAWAAWVAVKIAAESALRARSGEAGKIREFLEAPATQFDGHKGWPLSFRAADHQLRQPLYIVAPHRRSAAATAAPVDVPDVREVSSAPGHQSAQDALDRLAAGSVRCRWGSR